MFLGHGVDYKKRAIHFIRQL